VGLALDDASRKELFSRRERACVTSLASSSAGTRKSRLRFRLCLFFFFFFFFLRQNSVTRFVFLDAVTEGFECVPLFRDPSGP